MTVRAYTCQQCGYLFKADSVIFSSKSDLMCPACGSIDLLMDFDVPSPSTIRTAADAAKTTDRRFTPKAG
ncbi:MAG: hypothetical protein ACLQUT_05440 [Thermoleophilia bacterium]